MEQKITVFVLFLLAAQHIDAHSRLFISTRIALMFPESSFEGFRIGCELGKVFPFSIISSYNLVM